MRHDNLIKPLFYFGYSTVFVFAALKINHTSLNYDKELALVGFTVVAAFVIMALTEVYKSKNITLNEKIMWTIGFLCLNMITGPTYFFMGRKRITRS